MYKILKADKDTYITDRVINGERVYNSNVGLAGSLDLFKLYGATLSGSTPNTELSRLLIHFDLEPLRSLVSDGKLDPADPSFFARLKLFDVYGGQPTPENYALSICPLSRSFSEGKGRDVVYYADQDAANFFTASYDATLIKWIDPGCGSSGDPNVSCDYYTGSLQKTQFFKSGEEDLDVDVTDVITNVLNGTIPDSGFRISFSEAEETNQKTYFVKRFASKNAYNVTKHPRIVVGFDDSMRDTSQGMTLDSDTTIFFYNYDKGSPANLFTPLGPVVGSDCLVLKLQLPVSGGMQEFFFTGSQHNVGSIPATGIYSASIYLSSSNQYIVEAMQASGSVLKFKPVWCSLDGNTTFLSGSSLTVNAPVRGTSYLPPKKFTVTVFGLNEIHRTDEMPVVRANVFDYTSPLIKVVKTPVNSPGALQGIASDAFYSVRDAVTQEVVIPFDLEKGSTRISSDGEGLYFKLDMSNLYPERTYVIDVMLKVGGEYQRYLAASPVFKVSNTQ
jgi:hypothetical protein